MGEDRVAGIVVGVVMVEGSTNPSGLGVSTMGDGPALVVGTPLTVSIGVPVVVVLVIGVTPIGMLIDVSVPMGFDTGGGPEVVPLLAVGEVTSTTWMLGGWDDGTW